MKHYLLVALFISCAFIFFSCSANKNDIKISVKESGHIYQFTASYPESKTHKVQRVINNGIKPDSFFENGNVYVDATTTLGDKTSFYIKFAPGDLAIKLDRNKNTNASYRRIKEICEEIKNSLKD